MFRSLEVVDSSTMLYLEAEDIQRGDCEYQKVKHSRLNTYLRA